MPGPSVRARLSYYKKKLQYGVESAAARKAFFFETSRHGIEDVLDLSRLISPTGVLLDVGANIGQTAIRFRAAFPKARIISIEPVAETFAQLAARTRAFGIERHHIALGAKSGRMTMYLTPFSVTSSLVRPPEDDIRGTQEVEVVTLDQFAKLNGIGAIELLKIDAEGYDMEVIAGGSGLLSGGAVKSVLVEVGFHPGDHRHPLFDDIRNALSAYGFRVFGIYNQTPEWTGEPSIRFANAMFYRNQ